MAEYIYQMIRARKAHGDKVILDDVTMAFLPGAKIGMVGPNGAGKSSILKIMAGIDQPSNGEARLSPGYSVGILMQEPELDEGKTVLGNVEEGVAKIKSKLDRYNEISAAMADPDADFDALMEEMGIGECASSGVTEVSGGQLQRAGICRALINDPAVLFADEPTGALNYSAATSILDLFGRVHASGATMVVVTHDARVAARADRVLVLVDGGIVEDLRLGPYEEETAQARLETVAAALHRHSV